MQNLIWYLPILLGLLVFSLFLLVRNYLRMTTYRRDLVKDFYGTDTAMPLCVLWDIEEGFTRGTISDSGKNWRIWGEWEGPRWFMASHLWDLVRLGSWSTGKSERGPIEFALFLFFLTGALLVALRSVVSPKPDALRTLIGLDALMARRMLRKSRKRLVQAAARADS